MKRKGRGSSGLRHFFTSPTFIVLFFFRLSSAFYNIIQDCDEVFNFWEPLHFSLFGTGLQTWENRYAVGTTALSMRSDHAALSHEQLRLCAALVAVHACAQTAGHARRIRDGRQ